MILTCFVVNLRETLKAFENNISVFFSRAQKLRVCLCESNMTFLNIDARYQEIYCLMRCRNEGCPIPAGTLLPLAKIYLRVDARIARYLQLSGGGEKCQKLTHLFPDHHTTLFDFRKKYLVDL